MHPGPLVLQRSEGSAGRHLDLEIKARFAVVIRASWSFASNTHSVARGNSSNIESDMTPSSVTRISGFGDDGPDLGLASQLQNACEQRYTLLASTQHRPFGAPLCERPAFLNPDSFRVTPERSSPPPRELDSFVPLTLDKSTIRGERIRESSQSNPIYSSS